MHDTIVRGTAKLADAARLVEIVQLAYRGGLASVGWKNEHDLVTGPRVDEPKMRALIEGAETAIITVSAGADQTLCGCVLAEKHGTDVHIGMLAVHPDYQNMSLGKVLIQAAEQYGREHFGSTTGKMYVLSQRAELLAWYARLGYQKTGAAVPFPAEEDGSKPVEAGTILVEVAREL